MVSEIYIPILRHLDMKSIVSVPIPPLLRPNGRQRYATSRVDPDEDPLKLMVCYLQKELPYPLLSDPNRVLITALGAGEGGKTKRSHFIFEKGGKLVDKKVPVKPNDRLVVL